jgi:predicted ATPase/DNA-binding CsgD family transcriptional regulator
MADHESSVPNNLPHQLTTFIGRQRDLEMAKRLLSTTSLVTLTGAGGSGKTRLALQIATNLLDEYPDGVWVAELAPVSDAALLPHALAEAAGIREQAGHPLLTTLVTTLRSRDTLLVFDNCEHLIAACAQLIDLLLRSCPKLQILATSREALSIAGEGVWPVPPLAVPEVHPVPALDELARTESVRLFLERARAARPDFELTSQNAATVVQICRRLDGLPLAIELAAVRVKMLPLAQILARLDDRFRLLRHGNRAAVARHQTLRAVMDWSYNLLPEREQRLLRRLSAFPGGWTLESAAEVCGGSGIESAEVFDLLSLLHDKSLIVAETQELDVRFRLLETVRQYSWDKLVETGEDQTVLARHFEWVSGLAVQARTALWSADEAAWLRRLSNEQDNIRAALTWGRRRHGTEAWLRPAADLWRFWWSCGHWSEGRGWLEAGLTDPQVAPATRATALLGAGFIAWRQSDYAAALTYGEQALALCQESADVWGIVLSHHILGAVAFWQGDYKRVATLGEESLAVARASGDKFLIGASLELLAMAQEQVWTRASPLWDQAIALFRESWPRSSVLAISLVHQARVTAAHDGARAASLFEEALSIFRDLGDRRAMGFVFCGLGLIATSRREYERGETWAQDALAMGTEIGDPQVVAAAQDIMGDAARGRGDYARATSFYTASLAYSSAATARPHIAASLERLAAVACSQDRPERAARLLGAADSLREAIGADDVSGSERADRDRAVAAAQLRLGADAFAAARSAGRAMSLEEAVEYARAPINGSSTEIEGGRPSPQTRPTLLTPREREVTRLIARGLSNREIASQLKIAERTAEAHVQNILNKLKVDSRTQVAVWIVQHGLL